MRACSWIPLGLVALACSGSAFTADENGSGGKGNEGGSDSGASSSGGSSTKAGSGSGGSAVGNAGRGGSSSKGGGGNLGGFISAGGDLGLGGDLIAGGSPPIAGTTSVGGTTSVAGTTGVAGSGPDPIDKTCPKTQPAAGGGCMNGLVCTYGSDARTSCRPVAKCTNAKWALSKPECEALHDCPAFQVGSKCDAQVDKACMLNDTDGIYCVCTGCNGVGPCSSETVWACAAGSGGSACPKLPPNKGQACASEVTCGYGSCTTSNSASASCDGTTWDWDLVACPL